MEKNLELSYISSIQAKFQESGCAQLSDACSKSNLEEMGFSLGLNIINRTPNIKLCGPVFPVNTENDMLPCLQALHEAPQGYVIFLNNLSEESEALAGDIFVTDAIRAKCSGLVINGAVRDVADINKLGFPVFSKTVNFVSAKTAVKPARTVPEAVIVNGKTIYPNDWIFGDNDGVFVVRQKYLTALMFSIQVVQAREDELKTEIMKGNRIGDLCGLTDFVEGKATLKFDV